MGSSSSTGQETACDIMADYREVRRDSLGLVLQQPQTDLTFLLREYTYASEAAFEKERGRL
jgi:hypothetical protein